MMLDMHLKDINTLEQSVINTFPPEAKHNFKYYIRRVRTIKPKKSVGFEGKIYLLVDRRVYSSAESFAAFCKTSKWATLIGKRTGGDGIGIDPILCSLPNSGFVIRFTGEMGLNSDGSANEETQTEPDISVSPVRIELENYRYDEAVQEVLKHINK
ncbi:peptidase family S41 [Clostridium tepidiprofundi DSM 19306]|uniref:Peptidase family S41 n=1 Tax=Clostridium tepidiprofundi DSM 19306 TaxID=1121338 RepID=A0A151AQ06_9CLOT|nr:S41 family peptidase [Clostridium tepidiprofundi]KYH29724.1 peptidase family S41 [Clostridium tepidiprofundi DSM 19306]